MPQSQTATITVPEEKKGLRNSLRRWKDSFLKDSLRKDRPPSARSSKSSTPARRASPTSDRPTIYPPPVPVPPPPAEDTPALFTATTQTIIHSPLDKRNKATIFPSPASTLRRSYFGSRRNTAPADYFSLPTSGQGDAWVSTLQNETTDGSQVITGHCRKPSKLRFSLAKRPSTRKRQPSMSSTTLQLTPPVISPVPSAPSPFGHENEHRTFQYTTTAQIVALKETKETGLSEDTEKKTESKIEQDLERAVGQESCPPAEQIPIKEEGTNEKEENKSTEVEGGNPVEEEMLEPSTTESVSEATTTTATKQNVLTPSDSHHPLGV